MQIIGTQSIHFTQAPYILASASVVGKKEGEGPIGNEFDMICDTDKFGEDTWEEAESSLQKESTALALGKSGLAPEDIRYIFAGDLLGQTIATSFGLMDYQIPLFGLYGACSTAGESMALGAMCVAGGYADHVLTVTSSHFASAENSSVIHWNTPIRDRCRRPGRLREAGHISSGRKNQILRSRGLRPGGSWITESGIP